jgi:hypothetical protein
MAVHRPTLRPIVILVGDCPHGYKVDDVLVLPQLFTLFNKPLCSLDKTT